MPNQKSGSNQFHGSAFEFLRNDKLNANTWFGNATSQPRTHFSQNIFGGTVGGPIKRNRLFFFADYQGWDRAFALARPGLARALSAVGVASGGAAFIAWCIGPAMFAKVVRFDLSLGPFDAAGAYHDVLWALVQTAAVALACRSVLSRFCLSTGADLCKAANIVGIGFISVSVGIPRSGKICSAMSRNTGAATSPP